MQILYYIIKFIVWLDKIRKTLVFRYQLNVVIGRCIAKYGDNSPKTRITAVRWSRAYIKKREKVLHRKIVKFAWQKGKTVSDIEKEIS